MWAGVHHVATHSGWHRRRHDGRREGHCQQDRLHVRHTKGVCCTHTPAQHPSLSHPWHAVLKQQVHGDTPLVLPKALGEKPQETCRRAETSPFMSKY